MQIDHDPKEPKVDRSYTVFYAAWAVVAALWVWAFYFLEMDWRLIGLGFITGCTLATWAIETTGNKPWWRQ